MVKHLILFSLYFFLAVQVQAQNREYAQYILKTLSSEDYAGRGYVDEGHLKAAEFIADQMDSLGLQPYLKDDYFDRFDISVNTFPGLMTLKVNGRELEVGSEWLIDPASSSIKGRSECVSINSKDLASRKAKKKILKAIKKKQAFIVSDLDRSSAMLLASLKNAYEGIKIIELIEKPMWHISSKAGDDLHLKVLKDKVSEPISSIDYNIEAEFKSRVRTQNVISMIPSEEPSDSFFLFTAHYDHLGRMGKDAYTPGANDNASGISMLLNLASHYTLPENRPKNHNIIFIAFGAEEVGLKGAYHFVENSDLDLKKIKFLLNLDIVGTGDDGIQVVNSKIFEKEFRRLKQINDEQKYMKEIKLRGEAANSDHYPFYEKGVPCFFIYTLGGVQYYHDIFDRMETLPLTDYEDLFSLLKAFESTF